MNVYEAIEVCFVASFLVLLFFSMLFDALWETGLFLFGAVAVASLAFFIVVCLPPIN